jgi:transposase
MTTTISYGTQRVGALPVIAEFLEKMRLRRLVDVIVPWEGEVPLGDLVEILVANRLLEPKPIYKLGSWATKTTLANYYNRDEKELHDDRIGRALERIADHGATVQGALVLHAIDEFGLDVSQIHYDMSTVELYGDYAEYDKQPDDVTPRPAYGHSKSGRKDLKQIQFGLNVIGDGAVPIGHLAFDGQAPEAPTHIDNLKRLGQMLPKGKLLYLGDSKLDSKENLLLVVARKGQFLSSGALTPALQEKFLSVQDRLQDLDYSPKSQQSLPMEQRDKYRGVEVLQKLKGLVEGRVLCCKYRLIFVWSEAKARQESATCQRHLEKIEEALAKVSRNLNRYQLKTREAIVRRVEGALGRYAEGKLYAYQLQEDKEGRFALTWQRDAKGLARRQALDGIFVLKTNLSQASHATSAVLRTYREQIQVERRIGNLKGPLAVAPMYLKNPKRMAGLLYILMWALMVLALLERQVRRRLKGKPMYGLYPENRPSLAPTGVRLLEAFAYLCVIVMKEGKETVRHLGDLDDIQLHILELLDISPVQMRTFRRGCGT